VHAGGGELEEAEAVAFVVLVGNGSELIVNAIHVVHLAVISDVEVVGAAVGVQHAKVMVEGAVLLQHEDNVLDRRYVARSGNCYRRRSGGGLVAASRCSSGIRGGLHRGYAGGPSGGRQSGAGGVDVIGDHHLSRIGSRNREHARLPSGNRSGIRRYG